MHGMKQDHFNLDPDNYRKRLIDNKAPLPAHIFEDI